MAGQILRNILVLTLAVLLAYVCEVEAHDFPETSMALQFSYMHSDEPVHHIRRRRADSYTDYMVEIEIDASNSSVIKSIKDYLTSIQNNSPVANVTLLDTSFTTVCSLGKTGYQCKCEDQYFWPCDMCKINGSCSATSNTCSCINTKPSDGQYCKKTNPLCTQPPKVIQMSLRLNETFDTSLTKPDENIYKNKAQQIQSAIEKGYGNLPIYIKNSTKVIGFRPGSVIVDYTINTTDNSFDFTAANTNVSGILKDYGFKLVTNTFAQTEQKNLSTTSNPVFPRQSMTLNCPQSVEGPIQWSVNDKDPDLQKYSISDNDRTLTLKNATESDSGRYSCIITNHSTPYIQWQDIVINTQPQINVKGEVERIFPCDERTIQLDCCVNANYSIEWVLSGSGQQPGLVSEPGCITYKHTTIPGNCKEEIFTCRLKDLKQLYEYSYSMRNVKIITKAADYSCKDNTFGFGKTNDTTEGPCSDGKEGYIAYKCESGVWNPIQDNCVVKVIKDLETKVQVLAVKDIPKFVENLTFAAGQNNASITKSVATVQTIVGILNTIAEVSENITINKPVIQDFLTTVDIIISDESTNTWQQLNNGNQTEKNTSVELLQAIETISNHLSDADFDITLPNIQLNRNVTDDVSMFRVKSQLPDSTSEIEIPDVPKYTSITIIIFTDIGSVLPTRNTSNNDNKTSENQINGDVIVVKVNETINKISLTFDIKNTSLGNPQCVFWNFSLDRWDSTGCKVKFLGYDNVTCECNHTTSFTILMSPVAIKDPEKRTALAIITYIGVAISLASLILCLIIEIIVWKSVRRNDTSYMRHVSMVNIAVSLLIANICFIIGAAISDQDQMISVERCSPVVFFMHFFYLAVFFWMLISALLLLYRTVVVLAQMSRTIMMIIAFTVGYGAPLLIAVITVASTAGPKNYVSKENACWLNWYQSNALLAFVIPALTIVFINLVVLIVVVWKILRRGVGAATQPGERHILIVIARCVAFLTPIFGLTWGFGIGTMVSRDFGLHVVFALLNSLQGFFVLVFGILLDGKVRQALAEKLSLINSSSSPTRSTNAGTSSSSGLGFFEKFRRNVYNISNPSAARSANSSGASESLMNP